MRLKSIFTLKGKGIIVEHWKCNLILLVLGQFVVRVAQTFVFPYLPFFIAELGVNNPKQLAFWTGIIASANFLGQSAFSPLWGSLADHYGKKIMLIRSALAVGFFTIAISFVSTPLQLLIIRFLMGCFSGYNAAGIAFIVSETPKNRLGYALGWLQTGQQAGLLIGPAIGGVLAHLWGFRGSCLISGLIVLLICVPLCYTKEIQKNSGPKAVKGKTKELFSLLRVMENKNILLVLFFIIMITQFSTKSIEPQLASYIDKIYQGSNLELMVAGVFMVTAISHVVLAPVLGRYGDKNNYYPVLFWCLIGSGLTTLGQIFVKNIWQLLVLRFILGGFLAGALPSANALIGTYSQNRQGMLFGLVASVNALGNFVGPIFGGGIIGFFDLDRGFLTIFTTTGILLLVGSVFVMVKSGQLKDARSKNIMP
ncbi:MAG: MFS transporter [Dehalobacterium sp.]